MNPAATPLHFTDGRVPPPATATRDHTEIASVAAAMRVLVIEDETMIAWMMESLLEEMGFADITVVASGKDAVDAASTLHPGLILSDINLGPAGMDGIDAVAAISRGADASIVFITGYAGEEAHERIDRLVPGARLIRKPIAADTLRSTISEALSPPRRQ